MWKPAAMPEKKPSINKVEEFIQYLSQLELARKNSDASREFNNGINTLKLLKDKINTDEKISRAFSIFFNRIPEIDSDPNNKPLARFLQSLDPLNEKYSAGIKNRQGK